MFLGGFCFVFFSEKPGQSVCFGKVAFSALTRIPIAYELSEAKFGKLEWRYLVLHFFLNTPSRFHNDGRMLDVYQRLNAKEGMYFLPEDLELSNQELSYIVKKAEQWRGFNGERRKVKSSPSGPSAFFIYLFFVK